MIPVITPDEIDDWEYDQIIISTNAFRFEILKQLISLGIEKGKIDFYCPSWSLFKTIDISYEADTLLLEVLQKDGIRYCWCDEV